MIIDLIYRVAKWNNSSKGKLAKTKEWKQQQKKVRKAWNWIRFNFLRRILCKVFWVRSEKKKKWNSFWWNIQRHPQINTLTKEGISHFSFLRWYAAATKKKEAENKSRVATPKMFFSLIFHYSESTFFAAFFRLRTLFFGEIKESRGYFILFFFERLHSSTLKMKKFFYLSLPFCLHDTQDAIGLPYTSRLLWKQTSKKIRLSYPTDMPLCVYTRKWHARKI